MKVAIDVEIRHGGRSGVEVRSPDLRLASHGENEEEALESLRRGVIVWCQGLKSRGSLEEVIKRKGLSLTRDGESIDVELFRK